MSIFERISSTLKMKSKFIGLASICLAFSQTSIALAESVKSFEPKSRQTYRGGVIGGGIRGGCEDSDASELLFLGLAPQRLVGKTISTQPTLVWFAPDDASYEMRLQLYKYGDNGVLDWVDGVDNEGIVIGRSQQGYNSYTLPANLALQVGESYRWEILLICNPDRPSSNKVAVGEIHVEPSLPEINEGSADLLQRAQTYAAAELWYDAIGLLTGPSLTPEEIAYRRELVLDLAELEASLEQEFQGEAQPISDYFRAIADWDS